MGLKADTQVRNGVAIVKLDGDITLGESSNVLRDTIRSILAAGHKSILLDLSGVSYIDSAGLGELVGCYATVTNQRATLKLLNIQKKVQGLMQITKLSTVFESFENEAEAVRSFGDRNAAAQQRS